MGIWNRVKRIVSADVHETLDKLENPVSMLKQYLRETEQQVEQARQALAQQLYLEKKYETLIAEAEGVVVKRARQAELAVSRGEDQMAKLALQEKLVAENKLSLYRTSYEQTKQQTAALHQQIDQLQEKYQELQFKNLVLVSRLHAAKTQQQNRELLTSFHAENAVKGFARVEAYVQKLEAQAAASEYFSALGTPVQHVELQEEVQKQLEQLKAK
ncbi:PspA/IM30 family protein [Ectobacillus ponti]|uniref:PspA/IM30 family protein n=1 Tax=Ectobacillus ponti TaxID=2961894 RepID=A0AA42BNY0_9BACI|nr:PspA/IM30 family protein [Ectobacillus ponti]MCP8967826.1 PspA/IM30 family protein [Ectobacillus ponti]